MSNAIVLENEKQGNPPSEWGLSGPPSSSIEGFTSEFSIDAGNTVDFKINTDASEYRIDIYRLGYYGGDGARLITSVVHSDGPIYQPAPVIDATTGLVDAGNWEVTDTWTTPDDLVSGVYLAKVVREDGTFGENQIPFIVRNDSSTSEIVFQTDDTTWQAYNTWGGHSLYDGSTAVSYNRPFDQYAPASVESGAPDTALGQLFNYSYPAIRWLEQNGFDVSYISGIDTARDPEALLGHNVFISAGHDEYWSGSQRANVEAARDAGVNLVFWGGNDVYWRTRWDSSVADSSQDYHTLISYKTSQSGRPDPSGEWTGLWRDLGAASAYSIEPENSLIGTFYMVYNNPTEGFDSLVVDSDISNYRIWKNTEVANLAQGESLNLGAYLGYEWNVDAYNSARPTGLIHLSSTTAPITPLPPPENTSFYSGYQYTPPDPPGYATHSLTLYRAASGALVFSAGTISWTWALDDFHNGSSMPASNTIQQAMINLFADMGVQPQSLRQDLIAASASTDTDAPIAAIHELSTQQVTGGTNVTLSGTALDLGGTVAGVQISLDSGNTWVLASGTTEWSFSWNTSNFNLESIIVAAIDDSANVGSMTDIAPSYLRWLTESEVGTTDLGWDNISYSRGMADLNGDGSMDYVAFGEEAVYVNFGGTANGLPIIDFSKGVIIDGFSRSQGFTADSARGVEYVGPLGDPLSAPGGSIIWAQTQNGISYYRPVQTGADTVVYEDTPITINAFGSDQGWTSKKSFDFAVVSQGSDSTSSILGFGTDGIWLLARPFESGGSTEVYLASGSESFGSAAGWNIDLDVLAVRDFRGNEIDLNSDGILDVVGIGSNGITYAYGQQVGSTSTGSYSVGPVFEAPSFSRAEDWSKETPRMFADVDGDGQLDIVGFGDAGVWVALGAMPQADGTGAFGPIYLASPAFGRAQGWDYQSNKYSLADVNGDGLLDIVGFGNDLTGIALGSIADGSGQFSWSTVNYTPDYSASTAWENSLHLRELADVNGDGTDEFIVSGDAMTYVLNFMNLNA